MLVDAPPQRVWALVSDIDLPARFSTEFQGGRWLDGERPCAGRPLRRPQRAPGGRRVGDDLRRDRAASPGRAFAWAVGDPEYPSAQWRFELEPDGDGVRLRQWCQIGPAPSGLTPAIEAMPDKEERIVARRLEEHRGEHAGDRRGRSRQLAEAAP